jgi:F-type H+-transporting ATPase subunit c
MKRVSRYFGLVISVLLLPLASFAEEAAGAMPHYSPWIGPFAGLGIAIAAFGAALGQGRIGAAYMEGVSRNPGAAGTMRTFFILGLVFVETLVLFTLLIEMMLVGKA